MSEHPVAKILPSMTPLTEPFWSGCQRGELLMQHCDDCGNLQYYPRSICSNCNSLSLGWRAVSGEGSVASYTIVRRAISPAYSAPYVVALIDLREGPRMMSAIVGEFEGRLRVGAAVTVRFEPWSDDVKMPVFVLDPITMTDS
jgi:uncharacterized OB-fold protein